MKIHDFHVEGDGPFPIDMLRYGRCWPASGVDSAMVGRMERRTVHLTGLVCAG